MRAAQNERGAPRRFHQERQVVFERVGHDRTARIALKQPPRREPPGIALGNGHRKGRDFRRDLTNRIDFLNRKTRQKRAASAAAHALRVAEPLAPHGGRGPEARVRRKTQHVDEARGVVEVPVREHDVADAAGVQSQNLEVARERVLNAARIEHHGAVCVLKPYTPAPFGQKLLRRRLVFDDDCELHGHSPEQRKDLPSLRPEGPQKVRQSRQRLMLSSTGSNVSSTSRGTDADWSLGFGKGLHLRIAASTARS